VAASDGIIGVVETQTGTRRRQRWASMKLYALTARLVLDAADVMVKAGPVTKLAENGDRDRPAGGSKRHDRRNRSRRGADNSAPTRR